MIEHEDLLVVLDHDLVTEVLEDTNRQNLREDVSKVLGGLDVERFDDGLVTQHVYPFLSAVDMLQVALEAGVVGEGNGSCVVNA